MHSLMKQIQTTKVKAHLQTNTHKSYLKLSMSQKVGKTEIKVGINILFIAY